MSDSTPVTDQDSTVAIPADVYVQIECIRRFGDSNMTDRRGVQAAANRRCFYAAVVWLEANRDTYFRALINGSQPDRALTDDEQDAIDEAARQSGGRP